uniref:Uncharacterized protein MANES_17G115000 n=1 Tax=Rhizophora mucronata TaxID=61149 RepID=A0A2P2LJS2_RHIMU
MCNLYCNFECLLYDEWSNSFTHLLIGSILPLTNLEE